jgi:hypothetical protein
MDLKVMTAYALCVAAVACATQSSDSENESDLVAATENVVRFLRGEGPFDRLHLADTVTLRLAPDGGGARAAVRRASLRDPSGWTIRSTNGHVHSLVPFRGPAELTMREGHHLNCMERPLASVAPDLAELPHVGAMLRPPGSTSCLQTWNLTLVFEPGSDPPLLVAAVSDQWEW